MTGIRHNGIGVGILSWNGKQDNNYPDDAMTKNIMINVFNASQFPDQATNKHDWP